MSDPKQSLSKLGIRDLSILRVKDIGAQVAWKTVFLLEYAGLLVIHLAIAAIYGFGRMTFGQWIALAMIAIHYGKRELETLFVHRFSHATMPVSGMIKNCTHYWLVGGVALGRAIYTDSFTGTSLLWPWAFLLFLVAEAGNLYCHLMLSWLRPPGTKVRAIPRGFMFEYVSCPNYFFEALAWTAFALGTGSMVSWLFMVIGAGQMFIWAQKKHSAYLKEFKDYPKNRKAMFPFIA